MGEGFLFLMLLVVAFGSGFVAQYVASARGRTEKWYFWLGFVLPLIGILIAFGTPAVPDESPKPAPAVKNSPGISGELDELARLHKSGDLTDEQFEAAKRRVIHG